MDFGYFTLSDNHYDNNTRAPNQFVADIADEAIFAEGMEVVRKLWSAEGRISHRGKHYSFENVAITPKPLQRPLPAYVASFSRPSIELAARLGCGLVVAPFAAALSYGGLAEVAKLYRQDLAAHRTTPGRLRC